ncbi:hypothetical protein [Sorangium sp. So ce1078]|uniref:hypothetical protein n=1 Tax=Sorangium sp. So ce1078 TaxID=3133329 RepID=UPI003F5E742A
MRNIEGTIAIAALGLSGGACSGPDEYRPLGENDAVRIDVYGYDTPFERDGVAYRGDVEAYVWKTDNPNAFGIREHDGGEYLADTFVVDNGLEETTLRCPLWRDSYGSWRVLKVVARGVG